MASIFSHAFVAYGANSFFNKHSYWKRCLFFAISLSILPDADVIGFFLGVPYDSPWGHRGASHSILFSVILAAIVCLLFFRAYFKQKVKMLIIFTILSLSGISHGLLDAATNGGLGVGFFWPFDNSRYFLPFQPIEVSPIGIKAFFSEWGVRVILSELTFIILPTAVIIAILKMHSKIMAKK